MTTEIVTTHAHRSGRAAPRWALTVAAMLSLAGCASVPPLNFMPANIGMSAVKQNAALVSTSVMVADKTEAKGRIIAGTEIGVATLWKSALEDSVVRMAVFRDDAPLRLALVVKILQCDVPTMGLTMVTHTTARYELIDRNSGAIVYSTDVNTDGRSAVGDNFQGAVRVRISLANAVQANIASFLNQLESADLSKPMFPAQSQPQPSGSK